MSQKKDSKTPDSHKTRLGDSSNFIHVPLQKSQQEVGDILGRHRQRARRGKWRRNWTGEAMVVVFGFSDDMTEIEVKGECK